MSQDYNFYSNQEIPEDERRDVAFQTVNAIRESYTLAKKASIPITYEFAFDIIHDLNPKLYDSIINLLIAKNENELVKYFKEVAEAESTSESIVLPVDLIDIELEKVENFISKKIGKNTYLLKRKFELYAAKEYFTPRKQSEHKSLNHDFYLQSREEYFGKPVYNRDDYKDYKIGKNKILRLRLLHPDNEETILGVDLIYEHFDLQKNKVRFAHMQYKTWNENILYSSTAQNLIPQLKKMHKNICDAGFCNGEKDSERDYRFPYCSAFLRPTSKMQKPDSKLISTGLHIPVCLSLKLFESEGKLTKENCKEKSIKGNIFEELFTNNHAGSRWIKIDDLDRFYKSKNITSHIDRVRIHAQEVDVVYDQDKYDPS